jgi:hypothetical protein
MRLFAGLLLATLAFSPAAFADPVAIRPMTVDAELQAKFNDDYGVREIGVLQRIVERSLTRELTGAGATIADTAPVTIETTLVQVKPSKPTFQQAVDTPGLDTLRSIGIGGAELRGRILRADGTVLQEVTYKWYESDLTFSAPISTWDDARRAINGFADKVADAYEAAPAS